MCMQEILLDKQCEDLSVFNIFTLEDALHE